MVTCVQNGSGNTIPIYPDITSGQKQAISRIFGKRVMDGRQDASKKTDGNSYNNWDINGKVNKYNHRIGGNGRVALALEVQSHLAIPDPLVT